MLGRRRPAPPRTVNVTDPPPKKKWQLELEKNSDLEGTLLRRRQKNEIAVIDDENVIDELLGHDETGDSTEVPEHYSEKNLPENKGRVNDEAISLMEGDSFDEYATEKDHTSSSAIADNEKFSSDVHFLESVSVPNDETSTIGTKRKRYEWMDSDDEDITSSSDDEEEEEKESAEIVESTKTPPEDSDDLPNESTEALDQVETVECENRNTAERLETVRFAFISNISWEAKLEELAQWIEQVSGQRVLSLSTEGNLINNAPVNRKIGSNSHKGRVFIELENHQALLDILRLNERTFMGRPIRIVRAYKRNGEFFLLQSPAHFRFFYQQKKPNVPAARPPKLKQAKVDGGFNWAR